MYHFLESSAIAAAAASGALPLPDPADGSCVRTSGAAATGGLASTGCFGCSAGDSAAAGSASIAGSITGSASICCSLSGSASTGCSSSGSLALDCSSALISDCGCSSGFCRSSSMGAPLLSCQDLVDPVDGLIQDRVHQLKESGEGEDGQDHYSRSGLHLLAIGPSHALHFILQLANVVLGRFGPSFDAL